MKAILISDHAIWCALMMIGIKKTEVRKGTALYKATKKLIDEYGYAEFYVYCTKEKATRKEDMFTRGCNIWFNKGYAMNRQYLMNGKVVFKFRCYKIDHYVYGNKWSWKTGSPMWGISNGYEYILKDACLTDDELRNYVEDLSFSAIHISDLEIFDKPKELNEFKRLIKGNKLDHSIDAINYVGGLPLTKAPQNFCYINVDE